MEITDEQWAVVQAHLPERTSNRGRPRQDDRAILNGILWIMRTGAAWADIPGRYPPYQTCHRRYQEWVEEGTFERILRSLLTDLKERGDLDLTECFIDGTFVIAKKGARPEGTRWEKPSGTQRVPEVRNSWQWQTAMVFLSPYPLSVLLRMKSLASSPP